VQQIDNSQRAEGGQQPKGMGGQQTKGIGKKQNRTTKQTVEA
jgi:hypothetical protein